MKKTAHSVAFATILIPLILSANSTTVKFDTALTNGTEWVYSDIATNKDGNIYFKLSSSVQSPTFSFNITSVEITLSCTSTEPSRILQIIPSSGEATNAASVAKASTKETQIFEFDKTDTARSFSIGLTGGGNTGNWYIYSAVISGAPIIDAPTNLQADGIKGTRFHLSWMNPENAVSNRIEVLEIVEIETSCGSVLEYDFNDFMNNNDSSKDITDDFTNSIPAFTGSTLIRLPAHTNGIIQISKDNTRGHLIHSGFADYSDMSLVVSVRIPTTEHGKELGVSYLAEDGSTNQFAKIDIGTEFKTNTVSLASVPSYAPLVFNTEGIGINKRVVYVDYMAFTGAPTVNAATNVVATLFTAGSPMTVRGLSPNADYLVTVTAFDAEGNESSPSEPLLVSTTGTELPFTVRIR